MRPVNVENVMKIYWIKAQAPRRVLSLVKHLGLQAELVDVTRDLRSQDYLALNPNSKAPTLVDGDQVLWESTAIMAHLCIQAGSDMWPAHAPAEQVEVLRWLSWNDAHWAPAVGPLYFEHVVKPTFGFGTPDRSKLPAQVPAVMKLARILDDHLTRRDFVACGRLTIADFALASMATDWRVAEMPLDDFRNVVRWLDGLMTIPAWAHPWPEKAETSS